ncbi:leucine-rich repeat flightless-interacting protein 1 isoform X7 [Ascaphus truei]|uniref:leucine-rich repeat flightless-interacting protein 1 isoform X7 n=1 Tax=Ascaphus truei TaxID=8439 RepID=UPI003F5936A3
MGTQGPGRKRHPNRERLSAEDHTLNQIAREAEARLAAKRAARAEAREIRMKELERQQKEIYQVQKKYYGLDAKWGDIEQWMEDSERYSHRPRRNPQASDEDDLMSVGSRSSLRTNGYEDELLGAAQYRKSSRSSTGSGEALLSARRPPQEEALSGHYSDLSLASAPLSSKPQPSVHNGSRPSLLNCNTLPSRSQRGSLYDEGVASSSRRYSASSSRPPSEHSCYVGSGSRASSRASSARASPVSSEPPVFRRGSAGGSVTSLSHLEDVTVPAKLGVSGGVEERPDKDFAEKGSRPVSSLSAATLASLGGTSSRRGSGDTSISVDTEASIREIKDSLVEVEEKYKRSMVSNAQLDNEKSSLLYQVDTLRDVLLELEEELAESRRQYEDKNKQCERQKHEHSTLRFQLSEMKESLQQREEMLTEIRQLQQKQEGSTCEICDLKETIEWKDKKIGALERQKEFFEPVRSERDDLRDEVTRLREELKKHGIALDYETTPNGDASLESNTDPPQQGSGLGKANEAEMRKEETSKVGQGPSPGTEQNRKETQGNAREEVSLHVEGRGGTEGHDGKEVASAESGEVVPGSAGPEGASIHDGCTLSDFGTSSGQQGDGWHSEPKDASREEGEEQGEVLGHNLTEVDEEVTPNQRNESPTGSEIFQDAVDFVQTPNPTSGLEGEATPIVVDVNVGNEAKRGQKEGNAEEGARCDVEGTSSKGDNVQEEGVGITERKHEDPTVQSVGENSTKRSKSEIAEEEIEEATVAHVLNVSLPGTSEPEQEETTNHGYGACERDAGGEGSTADEGTKEGRELREDDNMEGEKKSEVPQKDSNQDLMLQQEMKSELQTDKENPALSIPDRGLEVLGGEEPVVTTEGCGVSAHLGERMEKGGRDMEQKEVCLAVENQPEESKASEDTVAPPEECEGNKAADMPGSSVVHESESIKEEGGAVKVNLTVALSGNQDDGSQREQEDAGGLEIGLERSSKNPKPEQGEDGEKRDHERTPDAGGVFDRDGEKKDSRRRSSDENQSDPAPRKALGSEGEAAHVQKAEQGDWEHEDEAGPRERDSGVDDRPRFEKGSSVDRSSSKEDVRMEDGADKDVRRGKGKNKEDCVMS